MVSGRRKRKARKLLGSHQRCWLWGRRLVLETLRAARWKPLEVRAADRLSPEIRSEVDHLTADLAVTVVEEEFDALSRRCGSGEHQGLLAKMPPFPWESLDNVLSRLPPQPFVLILDALQDPYNLGAIVRSAEVFGADAVVVGEQRQTEVTALTARASAGAVNYVPLVRTADLAAAAKRLRDLGCTVVGASEKGTMDASEHDFRPGCALVIGNEGAGLGAALRSACDVLVRIPQVGRIGSLNAAVAAGILCYEVRRRRGR